MAGYVPFIDPNLGTADLQQSLQQWGVEEDVNPFDLPDDHPAAKLRTVDSYFLRFVLNPEITNAFTIGQRLRKFYQMCMIRRSYVSSVDGRPIMDDMKELVHRRAICEFTGEELVQYQGYAKGPSRRIMRIDPRTGKPMWNSKYYRLLILLATWIGFLKIEDRFTAENTAKLLKKEDLLGTIVRWYCDANPGTTLPKSVEGQLALLCRGSPKIRGILKFLREVVVHGQHKLVLFASFPAQQVILYAILQALKIPTGVYHAHLKQSERDRLRHDFTTADNPMVFIGSYALTSCGLNLQHRCHWAAFIDPPPSKAIGEQAGARIHRVGQNEVVEMVTFSTEATFNDRQFLNNLKKAMPGFYASLNKDVFGQELPSYLTDGEVEFPDFGDWVEFEGELVRCDDPSLPQEHDLPRMKSHEFAIRLLTGQMGTPIKMKKEDLEEFGDD